jgi:Flp pilus assembly protein TadG
MTKRMLNTRFPVLTGLIWRNQRGVAAVEFGLLATVLTILLPAATDLALAIWANQQVGNAARAGSEYAAAQCWDSTSNAVYGTCANGISTAATSATSGMNRASSVTATSTNYCGNASASGVTQTCVLPCACASGPTTGAYVSVTANTTYTPIFPVIWGHNTVSLSATSVTRIN